MSTYSENWSGEADGVYPSTLTKRWVTTGETAVAANAQSEAEGGFTFEQDYSAAARRLQEWTDVNDGNEDDIELVARFQINTTIADFQYWMVLRGSGAAASETGYAFLTEESTTDDIGIRLIEYSSGTGSNLIFGPTTIFNVVLGEWLWMRVRCNGSAPATVQAKMWRDGDEEPSGWDIDTTDSTHTGTGWNGIGGSTDGNVQTDYLGGGTSGDTAPIDAGVGTDMRLTAAYAASLQTGTPDIRITAAYAAVLYKIFKPRTHQTVVAVIGTGVED